LTAFFTVFFAAFFFAAMVSHLPFLLGSPRNIFSGDVDEPRLNQT
jgi:hypothetical protein